MIFDVEFEKTETPFGVSVSLTYPGSKNQIKWFTPLNDVMNDNGKQFFANAKKGLTAMAVHVSDLQEKLAEQDAKDNERAMRNYLGGYGNSMREISVATAELVHGIGTDRNAQSILVDIQQFDVAVGKMQSRLGREKLYTAKEYRIDFMEADEFDKNNSEGTNLILRSLKQAASTIEQWYHSQFPGKKTQGQIEAADQANGKGMLMRLENGVRVSEFERRLKHDPVNEFISKNKIEPRNVKDPLETGPTLSDIYLDRQGDIHFTNNSIIDSSLESINKALDQTYQFDTFLTKAEERQILAEVVHNLAPTHNTVKAERSGLDADVTVGKETSEMFIVYNSELGDLIVPLSAHDLEVKTNHETGEQTPILKTATINISKAQVIEELRVAESRSKNAKNPAYWAHSCEDKVNGIKQQVEQNLPEGDPTRALISMISDLLSDHIYAMGKEEEPSQ